MRWFKHLSMAHSDDALSSVLEEHGPIAYGIYWLLMEHIAAPMESTSETTSVIHSDAKWAQLCCVSARKFKTIAQSLSDRQLICTESTDNRLRISIPNLLKYRDEYSKKSRHAPDKLPTVSVPDQIRSDQIKNRDTVATQSAPEGAEFSLSPPPGSSGPHVTVSMVNAETQTVLSRTGMRVVAVSEFDTWFEREFWPAFPKKKARAAAKAAAKRKMGNDRALMDTALAALKRQIPEVDDPRFFPNGSTWFNQQRWEDEPLPAVRTLAAQGAAGGQRSQYAEYDPLQPFKGACLPR